MNKHYDPIALAPANVRYLRGLSSEAMHAGNSNVPAEVRVLGKEERETLHEGSTWACEISFKYQDPLQPTIALTFHLSFSLTEMLLASNYGATAPFRFPLWRMVEEAEQLLPNEPNQSSPIKLLACSLASYLHVNNLKLYGASGQPHPRLDTIPTMKDFLSLPR